MCAHQSVLTFAFLISTLLLMLFLVSLNGFASVCTFGVCVGELSVHAYVLGACVCMWMGVHACA